MGKNRTDLSSFRDIFNKVNPSGIKSKADSLSEQGLDSSLRDKAQSNPTPNRFIGSSVDRLLSTTLDYSIAEIANSSSIQALIGASLQRAVPSILSLGARPTSWVSNVSPIATYGTTSYPTTFGAFGQVESLSPSFDIVQPMLADALAYRRAVADTQKSVYSQTPRAEGLAALAFPLVADYVFMSNNPPIPPLSYAFAANNYLSRGDSFNFDLLALLQGWLKFNSLYNATDGINSLDTIAFSNYDTPVNGYIYDGLLTPKRSLVGYTYPSGTLLGFKQTLTCVSVANSGVAGTNITAMAEAFRQLLTSPMVLLKGISRPFGMRGRDASVSNALADFTSVQGASGSAGPGEIAVTISMGVNISGQAYQYPKLDFKVAYDKIDNNGHVVLLVPRGPSVSGVLQPGFRLSSFQLAPLRVGNFSSLIITVDVHASGSAAGMQWSLSMANPASLVLKQLLL